MTTRSMESLDSVMSTETIAIGRNKTLCESWLNIMTIDAYLHLNKKFHLRFVKLKRLVQFAGEQILSIEVYKMVRKVKMIEKSPTLDCIILLDSFVTIVRTGNARQHRCEMRCADFNIMIKATSETELQKWILSVLASQNAYRSMDLDSGNLFLVSILPIIPDAQLLSNGNFFWLFLENSNVSFLDLNSHKKCISWPCSGINSITLRKTRLEQDRGKVLAIQLNWESNPLEIYCEESNQLYSALMNCFNIFWKRRSQQQSSTGSDGNHQESPKQIVNDSRSPSEGSSILHNLATSRSDSHFSQLSPSMIAHNSTPRNPYNTTPIPDDNRYLKSPNGSRASGMYKRNRKILSPTPTATYKSNMFESTPNSSVYYFPSSVSGYIPSVSSTDKKQRFQKSTSSSELGQYEQVSPVQGKGSKSNPIYATSRSLGNLFSRQPRTHRASTATTTYSALSNLNNDYDTLPQLEQPTYTTPIIIKPRSDYHTPSSVMANEETRSSMGSEYHTLSAVLPSEPPPKTKPRSTTMSMTSSEYHTLSSVRNDTTPLPLKMDNEYHTLSKLNN